MTDKEKNKQINKMFDCLKEFRAYATSGMSYDYTTIIRKYGVSRISKNDIENTIGKTDEEILVMASTIVDKLSEISRRGAEATHQIMRDKNNKTEEPVNDIDTLKSLLLSAKEIMERNSLTIFGIKEGISIKQNI